VGVIIPDLIVESIIRDGLENIKNDLTIIDDIFSELNENYTLRKYGAAEIAKIKTFFTQKGKSIAVVHSFHEAAAKNPAYSIQMGMDNEKVDESLLQDFVADTQEDLNATELQDLVKADNIVPDSYDEISGILRLPDSVDLSTAYPNHIYVDGVGTEHTIKGISEATGDKFLSFEPGSEVDISDFGQIKSFITVKQYEDAQVTDMVKILIGVHSKEALLTKYLYAILKYILLSRKQDMIKRCFDKTTLSGSDFTRDMKYQGDMVYTRFLTITGTVEDSWKSDKVDLIDAIEIDAEPIDC
jgi:hypothetical protein